MVQWPQPHSPKSIRGFLGLTGYYRKFIRDYGLIVSPLTALLKKNAFCWTLAATQAFEAFKRVVTSPPVLRLPDFTQPFVIEFDTSGSGLGTVLMQKGRPIAFLSKAIKGQAFLLSTYGKELLSLVTTVQKWRPYLLGHSFVVRTDHQSLKFLLEQKVGTVAQQHWLSKLLGYNFVVEYKKGRDNKVEDGLSRQSEPVTDRDDFSISLISFPTPDWVSELKSSYHSNAKTFSILEALQTGFDYPKGFFSSAGPASA
jgi:hypothetical protein